jgi:hypothetical protein
VPCADDPHPQHQAVRRMAEIIVASLGGKAPEVLEYEGLTPLAANRWLDIGAVAEEKFRRLRQYASQERRYRLSEVARHLAAYRARTLVGRRIDFAEAYRRCRSESA